LVADQVEPLLLKNGRFCLRRDLAEQGGVVAARRAFREFYVTRGRDRLVERVRYFAPKVGTTHGSVTIRELGHRWASYAPSGKVAFHWKCLMAPASVLDYLVVHELCHSHHLDHSAAFWNEVDKVLPHYVEQKECAQEKRRRLRPAQFDHGTHQTEPFDLGTVPPLPSRAHRLRMSGDLDCVLKGNAMQELR